MSNGGKVKVKNQYSSIFRTQKRHNMHRPEYLSIIAILVVKFSIGRIQKLDKFCSKCEHVKKQFFRNGME